MDEMTPDEFRLKLDELMAEEYFPPVAITRGGEARIVAVPAAAWRSMRRAARRIVRTEDMTEEDLREIVDAKMPDDLLKDD